MRTTIEIDDDLLAAARGLANRQRATLGRVVSDLLRQALRPRKHTRVRNGVPLLDPVRGAPVPSLELVNRLRDSDP